MCRKSSNKNIGTIKLLRSIGGKVFKSYLLMFAFALIKEQISYGNFTIEDNIG